MKICHTWLQRYLNLEIAPEKISHALTERGLEVENIKITDIASVITAKVVSKKRHPNAEKLSICEVDNGSEILQIVCGATNVESSQIVLLAEIGSVLPGNFKIKKSKIRGEISCGMLCSEKEIGLGTSHDGIMILDPSTPIGQPLKNLMSPIYELSITPNRPDALSHIGCARELASYFNKTLTIPKAKKSITPSSHPKYRIQVQDSESCPLYIAYVIEGVKVEPSPDWLQKSLSNIGLQPINNIVDLTNFVLMEFGQPSHAFDLKHIQDSQIILRHAEENEILTTLDGVERKLTPKDFVIADSKKVLCLGGVIGGEESKITQSTSKIILEVAYFNPIMVRKQSKRHSLSTDSSFRFERGIDSLATQSTGDYLAEIITELTGGRIISKNLSQSQNHPTKKQILSLRQARIKKILGFEIEWHQIINLLKSVEIETKSESINSSTESLDFIIPSFRVDIQREIDLIQDIARLYNFNKIPTIFPKFPHKLTKPLFINQLSKKIRDFLSHSGLNECLHLRFVPQNHQNLLYQELQFQEKYKVVPILNALNQKENTLPTTLIYNLLKSAQFNFNQQASFCRFFEIGKIFFEDKTLDTGVKEENYLAILLSGIWTDSKWLPENKQSNFYLLKGLVENLFLKLKQKICFVPSKNSLLHPKESLDIELQGNIIGSLGTLHLQTQRNFSIKENTWICEINLDLFKPITDVPKFKSISPFSKSSREMNIMIPQEITHSQIMEWINKVKTPFLTEVYLNSIYEGSEVPVGKKIVHYRFIYQSFEKTLTDKAINQYQEKLAEKLKQQPEITFK